MPAPYDLVQLHALRRRSQCPKLPVFVTDCWEWQQKLADLGALCIRVRHSGDFEHDWSALRGMHCILLLRTGSYAPLGMALLEAGPSQLETFHPGELQPGPLLSRLVVGTPEPIEKLQQRDALLERLLRH